MTITVGYIGVITVMVTRETWDDFAEVIGEDPAGEVRGFRHRSTSMLHAWEWASREITRRGGTVIAPAPEATTFRVVIETTDIMPVTKSDEVPLDKAAATLDVQKQKLEDGLCSGWSTSNNLGLSYAWEDTDGYTVRLRLMSEPEFRSLMTETYGTSRV